MKTKHFLTALLVLFISTLAFAQKNKGKDDLLFMLRQKEHINQAIKTIESLKTNNTSKLIVGDIVIIVCGEAVVNLTTDEAKTWVGQIEGYKNVSIMACGLSLDKFQKKEADLVSGIKYTRNGFIKAFELQKLGYLSVEL
jgi:intracellular sulfur oxidation DsrE/DsrF family protein